MSGQEQRNSSLGIWAGVALVSVLAACQPGTGPLAAGQSPDGVAEETLDGATSVKLVDRDVEAPEVFQVTDTALWDGRPSLGGVWVASPEAQDPERVILRNPGNGKFVIGALFRRERENPGPSLQISSDAAEALGVLAGEPVKINVTALRREEAQVDASKPILDAAETVAAEDGGADANTDAGAIASAATTALETAKPANSGPTIPSAPAAMPLDATETPAETPAAAAPPATKAKKPGGLFGGLFKGKARKSSEAEAVGTVGGATLVPDAGAVTAAPLDAPAATKPGSTPTASAAKPEAKPAATPATGDLRVQIGIFSVEANAKRAMDTLTKAGIAASIRQGQTQGKNHWSVTASGTGDKAAFLKKIQGLGFADAYAVK